MTAIVMIAIGYGAWMSLPREPWMLAGAAFACAAAGAFVWFRGRRARPQVAHDGASARDAAQLEPSALIPYIDAVEEQVLAGRAEIGQTQDLFLEAIGRLIASFNDITVQAREQQALAVGLAAGEEGSAAGNLTRGFDDFVKETSETLQFFVDATVQNSKLAMGLIDLVEKVRSHANSIQGALKEVQGIAKQTDLLALNAAIEAARAGEAGRGFAVVADQVRMLSTRTGEFSRQIHGHVKHMHNASAEVEAAIAEIASRDMNVALQSKRRVGEMMNEIGVAHEEMRGTASQLAERTEKLEREVNAAVTSMQFQDMVTQLLGHVGKRLDGVSAVTVAARPLVDANADESARAALASEIEAARANTSKNPVKQGSMETGDIELF